MKKIAIVMILLVVCISNVMAFDYATEHTQIINSIELILNAARQLESLNNQQIQIQNQIIGLQAVANYQGQFNGVNNNSAQIQILINAGVDNSNQTQGLLSQMQQAANNLTTSGTSSQETIQIGQGTMQIVQNSLGIVAKQRQEYAQEQASLNVLLSKSDSAVGQTQAIQTSNQLAGQIILQMQLMRELLSQVINLQAASINQHNQEQQDQANVMDQMYQESTPTQSNFSFPDQWSINGT